MKETINFNLANATPWPEFDRMHGNMKSLRVIAAGKEYKGVAKVSINDNGVVTFNMGGMETKSVRKAKK